MALPVAATPVLIGKEADIFFAKIKCELQKPSRPIATPKLKTAHGLIIKYANKRRQE